MNCWAKLLTKIFLAGYKAIYTASFIMMSTAIIYCLYNVQDNKFQEAEQRKQSFWKDFLSIEHVKTTFRMCFKEGPANRKIKMKLIMVLCMFITGPFHGMSGYERKSKYYISFDFRRICRIISIN